MSELTTTHKDALTVEMFQAALPEKMRKCVNDELINSVNAVLSNPDDYAIYRENLISYTHVMMDGKYKIENYLEAVRYAGFKAMGHTNNDAYMKTFPDKWQRWIREGVASKDMASYVTAYHKGKLVTAILTQMMIPSHILNQDMFQAALNIQFKLMNDEDVSPKVRSDAANSLLTHLKPPETKQIELNVSNAPSNELKDLGRAVQELVANQRLAIQSGSLNAQDIAHSRLVSKETETVEYKES
jgi:hypothetical protein